MPIKVNGVAGAMAGLAAIAATAREAALLGLEAAVTERVALPSQDLVPLDLGPLRESMRVTRDGDTVSVSYGRDDDHNSRGEATAEYAVIQHEDLDFNHAPGRQAKYLEQPGLEFAHGGAEAIAAEVAKRMPK